MKDSETFLPQGKRMFTAQQVTFVDFISFPEKGWLAHTLHLQPWRRRITSMNGHSGPTCVPFPAPFPFKTDNHTPDSRIQRSLGGVLLILFEVSRTRSLIQIESLPSCIIYGPADL